MCLFWLVGWFFVELYKPTFHEMKPIAFIIFSLFSISCFSQTEKQLKSQISGIPRGVKQIVLSVDESKPKSDLMSEIVSLFMAEGYEVESINQELGLFQTKAKSLKWAWSVRFSVVVTTGKIRLRGKVILEMADDAALDIANIGSLGDAHVYSFREMVRLANSIPHNEMEYSM